MKSSCVGVLSIIVHTKPSPVSTVAILYQNACK